MKKIFIKGTLYNGEKTFINEDVMVPEDISIKEAKHLLKIGVATCEELDNDNTDGLYDNSGIDSYINDSNDSNSDNKEEKDEEEIEVDDLTIIKGIGEKTEKELIGLGCDSFKKLANALPKELAKLKTITLKEAKLFIKEAKEIIKD